MFDLSVCLSVCDVLMQVQRLEGRVVRPLTEYGRSCRQVKVCRAAHLIQMFIVRTSLGSHRLCA